MVGTGQEVEAGLRVPGENHDDFLARFGSNEIGVRGCCLHSECGIA